MDIIVTSSTASTTDAFSMLAQGAIGFLPKQAKGVHFINAIRAASTGYSCIPAEYISEFVALRRNVSRTGNPYGLSQRELEILKACAAGEKTKEVAERLSISVRTVETHRNAIYRKTSCRDLGELARMVDQA